MAVELEIVAIDRPGDTDVILGQAPFIKTVEDVLRAIGYRL